MKKILLLTLSILLALGATELAVRYVIQYPVYGVSQKVHYRNGAEYWTNFRKPYSKYWNVEGGNKVYSTNNLGLPGTFIDTTKTHKIALLGSSFIEAYQVPPACMASSIFDKLLAERERESMYAIYNLGKSGHDPHDSWFRLKYFEQKTKFDFVVLVLNSDNVSWFARHPHPLSFELPPDFGKTNQSKSVILQLFLRNNSAYVAVLVNLFKGSDVEVETKPNLDPINTVPAKYLSQDMKDCLIQFQSHYGKRFIVLSIVSDDKFDSELQTFATENNIQLSSVPLIKPEYMLHGAGHLNTLGNQVLGVELYKCFQSYRN